MLVARDCGETVMLVETRGRRVDGVDDDHARLGEAARGDGTREGIPKKLSTKALAVQHAVKCQSRKQHRWDRFWRTATDPLWQFCAEHEMSGEAEVRDHTAIARV